MNDTNVIVMLLVSTNMNISVISKNGKMVKLVGQLENTEYLNILNGIYLKSMTTNAVDVDGTK